MVHQSNGFRSTSRAIKDKAPREASFQRKLLKKLREIPNSWWATKEAKSIRGLPDIYGCINGRFVSLECKRSEADSKHNTGRICLQLKTIRDMIKAGGFASMVYPENEAEILEELYGI